MRAETMEPVGQSSRWVAWAALVAGSLGAACSADVSVDAEGTDVGSTRALIRIERSETVDPEGARAYALARFANVSSTTPGRVLELLDLGERLPEPGTCLDPSEDDAPSLAALGRVELLEAGDVSVSAADQITSLAPRAFPTVKDLVSGVVYSTRDQATEPLPAGASYRVSTSGSLLLAPLDVTAEAPESLADVLVDGFTLGELGVVRMRAPLDFSWSPGADGDLVVFELSDGVSSVVCSFEDRLGRGSVSQMTLEGSSVSAGIAMLSLHRVRVAEFSAEGITEGELRFDFELGTSVQVRR